MPFRIASHYPPGKNCPVFYWPALASSPCCQVWSELKLRRSAAQFLADCFKAVRSTLATVCNMLFIENGLESRRHCALTPFERM